MPPKVKLPDDVTVPDNVMPLTDPVPDTEVTVPPGLDEAIVIDPEEFVMVTFAPAVKVVRVNPDPLPISSAPFAGVEFSPVPPFATGKVPVTPEVKDKPEQLVSVPEEGVPKAPPLPTNDPGEPMLMAKAEATLVPRPDTPVAMGSPVQLVNVPEVGTPSTGEIKFGALNTGKLM